jgi:hypothetical protein
MAEPTRKTFAEQLIAQDQPVSEEKYREHRAQLEKALTDSSRREFRVRMTVLVLWTLCLVLPIVLPGIIGGSATILGNGRSSALLGAYRFPLYILLIVTIVETVSYFVRFLPARMRAGSALNRAILHDLDRRITDLAGRIEATTKENRSEPTGNA